MPNKRLDNDRLDARLGGLSPGKVLKEVERAVPVPAPKPRKGR